MRVFTEVMRPLRVESLSELWFFIVFADQYTKFVLVNLRKAEIEALVTLKQLPLIVGTLKKLKRDNAMEFL